MITRGRKVVDDAKTRPGLKKAKLQIQPGKPLLVEVISNDELGMDGVTARLLPSSICQTLKAYREAARALVEGKYATQRHLAPPHMQGPCNIFVVRCTDGILVRYELVADGEPKVACAQMDADLSEAAPILSEQVIHFPKNQDTYNPLPGPEIVLRKTLPDGTTDELARFRPLIYGNTTLPDGFKMPQPPGRPPALVSLQNEFDFQMHGVVGSSDQSVALDGPDTQHFIAHSRFRLNVGWQTFEVYPPLDDEYWKPELAGSWAELDLLAAVAQKNLIASTLHGIDSRGATRKQYAALLGEFQTLLSGPEEPVHQFIKKHPELLCPTHEKCWSKLSFGVGTGKRVSDFVFREPRDDYLLVEIEAPIRELFRKDGQQREELTHAINQVMDWIQYIMDNRQKVEKELGLAGISTNPRTLIVIGRASSLSTENRRKLTTLEAQHNKLRILTYDDLLASARAHLEHILGPLELQGQNAEFFFFKRNLSPT